MAEIMGPQSFAPPNPEYLRQQQQPGWSGQGWGPAETRGIGGPQGQPLSPSEFGPGAQPPGGVQGQPPMGLQGGLQGQPPMGFQGGLQGQPPMGFQGGLQGQPPMGFQGGLQGQVGMPQAGQQVGGIAPHERAVLRGVLDILREGRVALASGAIDAQVAQRLTGAHAFLCGFLEGKGQVSLGSFLKTIPPLSTRGSVLGDPRFDQMVDNLECILSEGAETRFGWSDIRNAFQTVVQAAPTIWKVGQEIGKLVG